MRIGILGYGNMGQTYAKSFINSGFVKCEDIFVLTRNSSKIEKKYGIPKENFMEQPSAFLSNLDILIVSVKPQDFNNLAFQINSFIKKDQLILSVMAGITIDNIKNQLNTDKVVRSMPNLPSQIGFGVTVFSASNEVDRKELFIIQNLINTTGKSLYLDNENLINPATAISGSGPAYVFYFMNAISKAAQELGFTCSEADFLVQNTFLGTSHLQQSSKLSNNEWIEKVASKGGTTEAALNKFNKFELNSIIEQGVFDASDRALELGKIIAVKQ